MYSLLRELLFRLPTETSHYLALDALNCSAKSGASRLLFPSVPSLPVKVMGIDFPNPVGLAAGLDKNGDYIEGLAALGFGFIEVGTVTPRPQPGNPQPRLFRLPQARAIINRMGFNNQGVDYLVAQVQKTAYKGVLGINIGKNKDTPAENAVDDYLICLRKVYAHASYITVNLSSPNTPGLRDLQFGEPLKQLLDRLKTEQQLLATQYGRYVPFAIKVAPDMAPEDIRDVAAALKDYRIDAVIATNTTIDKSSVQHLPHGNEAGGLSGAPLTKKSTALIAALAQELNGALPIIGVGGIMSGEDAAEKIKAGAALVQIYTGFIYRGPELVGEAVRALARSRK
ncbi:MAG TPA: quinone-dependent dihydroorotate dehydrogenase [Spongiibacteraceae bacterium]|nr:quinone-dependent dihydroorotate dehydrogenase [Spongiibacteraceae bacterium]